MIDVAHAGARHHREVPSPLTSWTFDPGAVAALLGLAFLYERRARTLAARGASVPAWRRASFRAGLLVLALAWLSPIHALGEETFQFVHMAQHILIGEVAAFLLVLGLTGPLLRPLLALGPVERLRGLAHPLVAWPLWALNLYLWHLPGLYEAALASPLVHALEHALFLACGALFWAPVLEPLPGPAWFGSGAKLLYIVAARLAGMVLANVLIWAESPFYGSYVHASAPWGISAAADQGIAGSLMMVVDGVITMAAIAWLFLRLAGESELRQQLIERGVDPAAAARAVRYGRGREELAERG